MRSEHTVCHERSFEQRLSRYRRSGNRSCHPTVGVVQLNAVGHRDDQLIDCRGDTEDLGRWVDQPAVVAEAGLRVYAVDDAVQSRHIIVAVKDEQSRLGAMSTSDHHIGVV